MKKIFLSCIAALVFFTSSVSVAEGEQLSPGSRFIEVVEEGNVVTYAEGAYPPPPDDVGMWRHQIVFDYTRKQVWYYVCEYTEQRGQLFTCLPKFGDFIVTPDPSSLPEDVVVGMVRKILPSGRAKSCVGVQSKIFGLDQPVNCMFAVPRASMGSFEVIWPVEFTATEVKWASVLIRDDGAEMLLRLIGQETVQDTAKGGVQVFLVRGDGSRPVQTGVAVNGSGPE